MLTKIRTLAAPYQRQILYAAIAVNVLAILAALF